jgi:outer membrane protein OmpA-like peptidoglycan-associated protein
MAEKREDHSRIDGSCCEGLRRCDFLSRSPTPRQAPATGEGTMTHRKMVKKRSDRLSSIAGLEALLVGTLSLMTMPVWAQTAEELAKQYAREKMEQALETKQRYDLFGVRFDLGKATIGPGTEPLLDDIATAMTNFPTWRLRIVGHTDSTGDPAHNEALSLARAEAIKAALIGRGIAVWRLEAAGAGQNQPVAGNDTPEGQALNRRVELARLESEAANLMKAMSDYLAGQEAISFAYDANLEVVTTEKQKLAWPAPAQSISTVPARSAPRAQADSPMWRASSTGTG